MQYLRSFETARVVFLDQVGINEERWGKLLFFIETPKSLQDFDFAVGILAQLVVHQKARFNFRASSEPSTEDRALLRLPQERL